MMLTEWLLLYMPFIVNNLNHKFDMLQQNEWLFRFILNFLFWFILINGELQDSWYQ